MGTCDQIPRKVMFILSVKKIIHIDWRHQQLIVLKMHSRLYDGSGLSSFYSKRRYKTNTGKGLQKD